MQRLTFVNMGLVALGAIVTLASYWLLEELPWLVYLPFLLLPLFMGLMGGLWLGCRFGSWLTGKVKR